MKKVFNSKFVLGIIVGATLAFIVLCTSGNKALVENIVKHDTVYLPMDTLWSLNEGTLLND